MGMAVNQQTQERGIPVIFRPVIQTSPDGLGLGAAGRTQPRLCLATFGIWGRVIRQGTHRALRTVGSIRKGQVEEGCDQGRLPGEGRRWLQTHASGAKGATGLFSNERSFNVRAASGCRGGQGQALGFILQACGSKI